MKISLEQKDDPILKSPCYSLSMGIKKYHYEKLVDILYRVAVIFEPPQEEEKPKKKYIKRSEKFPLGDAILKVLPGKNASENSLVMGDVIQRAKTPRSYSMSIWGAVMGKLVKRGKVKQVMKDGIARYRLTR